jgi:CO/xanthine dehydrogenase Mo-binding subunit
VLIESVGLKETMERSRESSDWDKERAKTRTESRFREGIGAASCFYGVGLGAKGKHLDSSGARVDVRRDGSVSVSIGMTEMGQGSETVMTQIASETLGCKPEAVIVAPAETSVVPDSGPTVASRTTLLSGNAVYDACSKIAKELRSVAADLLGTKPRYVRSSSGYFVTEDPHEIRIAFQKVVEEAAKRSASLTADGWYQPPDTSFDDNGQGDAYYVYSYATQIAKVEVDVETGRVRILKLVAAHDVGKAVNPLTTRGQIEGGVMTGAGLALYEDFKLSKGTVETCDFATYIIPTAMDSFEIVPIIVEDPWPDGPFGAKGFAETPTIPTAAAIANAIKDAIGIRMTSLPMTPEKVYRALKNQG